MDFLQEARALGPWILEQRRALHRCPEHGNREFRTSAYLCQVLTELGLAPKRLLDTAVLADLAGEKPGPVIALRADMDALPVQEATGLPYASENPGMMHACGHDLHMAALLGTARLLASHRAELPGVVRFLFQPDEELDGGAARMIDAGCLEGVSQVYGAHVRPDLPAGMVGTCSGPFYAASNPFAITLRGKSAHGAEPQNGADAIVAGAQIVTALQTLVSRRMAPTAPAVITVGTFHAGTQCNIVAGEAVLEGILRTFGQENRRFLTEALTDLVRGIAASMGVEAQVEITWGYPGVVNHREQADLVRRAAQTLLGPERVTEDQPRMVSEDFGYYLLERPGCFFHMGVGGPAPLHSDRFCPEEWPLPDLSALHAQIAWSAMTRSE